MYNTYTVCCSACNKPPLNYILFRTFQNSIARKDENSFSNPSKNTNITKTTTKKVKYIHQEKHKKIHIFSHAFIGFEICCCCCCCVSLYILWPVCFVLRFTCHLC